MALITALGAILVAVKGSGSSGLASLFIFLTCAFFLFLAVWGILTTIGLYKMKWEARYSIVVIGAAMLLVGLVMLPGILSTHTPAAKPPNLTAAQMQTAQTGMAMARISSIVICGSLCAVGVWWLVYFNMKSVRAAFSGASGEVEKSRRPFLISVIAVLSMIGAVFVVAFVFSPMPGVVFGSMINGWVKAAVYLTMGVVQALSGMWLWQLQERGRRLQLGYLAFNFLSAVVGMLRPNAFIKYNAEIHQRMFPSMPQPQMPHQLMVQIMGMSFGILIIFAYAAVLIYYRKAFEPELTVESGD
jgi:hypothetical protein